jgi:uncharacterized protein
VVVRALINAADINVNIQEFSNRDTALIVAARGGHSEVVQVLINAGANVDIQNSEGNTALMVATQYPEIVKALTPAAPIP